jgi:excisionase family DNA binding protein
MSERLVCAGAIAERLGVPKSWVAQQARQNAMPHVRLGRYVRFDEDEVQAWVESLKAGGGPAYRRHRPREVA